MPCPAGIHADIRRGASAMHLFYEGAVRVELLGQNVEVEPVGDGRGGRERTVEGTLAVTIRIRN